MNDMTIREMKQKTRKERQAHNRAMRSIARAKLSVSAVQQLATASDDAKRCANDAYQQLHMLYEIMKQKKEQ